MGMHRDATNMEFDPIERNTRRQVWWSIYSFERILCSILGRPTVIDDREVSMKIPDAPMLEQQTMSAEFMTYAHEIVRKVLYNPAEGILRFEYCRGEESIAGYGRVSDARMQQLLRGDPSKPVIDLFTHNLTRSKGKNPFVAHILPLHAVHYFAGLLSPESGEKYCKSRGEAPTVSRGLAEDACVERRLCRVSLPKHTMHNGGCQSWCQP